MTKGKIEVQTITTPEPRPVFIELNFDSGELTTQDAVDEVFCLHDAIQERLEDNAAVIDWGRLAPIAMVGPLSDDSPKALTVVGWPEDESIDSLDKFMSSYCSEASWTANHRLMGPGHNEWKDYLWTFWYEGYQFNPDTDWRRD